VDEQFVALRGGWGGVLGCEGVGFVEPLEDLGAHFGQNWRGVFNVGGCVNDPEIG
jgi:hypothetical protein